MVPFCRENIEKQAVPGKAAARDGGVGADACRRHSVRKSKPDRGEIQEMAQAMAVRGGEAGCPGPPHG